MREEKGGKMFKITSGRGFHITFPNRLILSTQFGFGNYCSHKDLWSEDEKALIRNNAMESYDCEIAIFKKNDDNWLTKEMNREVFKEELNDDVKGWVEIEDWIKIFNWCVNYTINERRKRVK